MLEALDGADRTSRSYLLRELVAIVALPPHSEYRNVVNILVRASV
jgi:hypothetical protein